MPTRKHDQQVINPVNVEDFVATARRGSMVGGHPVVNFLVEWDFLAMQPANENLQFRLLRHGVFPVCRCGQYFPKRLLGSHRLLDATAAVGSARASQHSWPPWSGPANRCPRAGGRCRKGQAGSRHAPAIWWRLTRPV